MRQGFLVALLIVVCVAQFDHTDRQAAPLNLVGQGTQDSNGRVSLFSSSVSDVVVGAMCRSNVHTVSSVQTNNGPSNSGTYFRVTITQSNSTLNLQFGAPDEYFNILESTVGNNIGSVGSCAAGVGTCTFDYYCDIYANETPLEVIVYTNRADDLLTNSINRYTLAVSQYTTTISIVPASRTFAQTTPVVDPFPNANTFGPGNFVQYYHDLQPTAAEAGASSLMYIQASGITPGAGTSYVCVSFSNTVASNNALTGLPFQNNANIDDNTPVSVSDPSGCPILCQSGVGTVTLVLPACNGGCGFQSPIWIGIRTPSSATASSYTVNVSFRQISIPDLITITSVPDTLEGKLVDSCDGENGDFSCNDYYEVSLATIGNPTFSDSRVGPYLAVELYAVHNGEASFDLTDGYLSGSESRCASCGVLTSCAVCDHCAQTSCWIVRQPCQWNSQRSNKWYITVEGQDQENSNEAIEYALKVGIGSWPLDTIVPSAWKTGAPTFGEVLPSHYHHYQVVFADADVFPDSYFEVELYTLHEEDQVAFAWNFNQVADDGTCFGNLGYCETSFDCGDSANFKQYSDMCRFTFIACPSLPSNSYTAFNNDIFGDASGQKLGSLRPGTFYFAVWGLQNDAATVNSKSYDTSVPYTITWNLHRSTPLYDQVTVNVNLFNLDYGPQYFVEVPNDPSIFNVRFVFSEAHNSLAQVHYVTCGTFAGPCPCFTQDVVCTTGPQVRDDTDVFLWDCEINYPVCQCPERILYVSTVAPQQISPSNPVDNDPRQASSYTITVFFESFATDPQPIAASRVPTTITDYVSYYPFDNAANFGAFDKIYRVTFTNIDDRFDGLRLSLRVIAEAPEDYFDFSGAALVVSKDRPYPAFVDQFTAGPAGNFFGCDVISICTAIATNDYNALNSNRIEDTVATCNIFLQPCYTSPFSCTSDCEEATFADQSFDTSRELYLTVFDYDPYEYSGFQGYGTRNSKFSFTLDVQVIEQVPYTLTAAQPFYGYVQPTEYVHMVYEIPSSLSANTRLFIQAYSNFNQGYPLEFFINYQPAGQNQFAGRNVDCYGNLPCFSCLLDDNYGNDDRASCGYEISPCELSQQRGGSYYLSMRGYDRFDLEYIYTIGYGYNTFGGNDVAEFTVTVFTYSTVALLDGLEHIPQVGNVFDYSSSYYSVTLPNPLATGNILGRILEIEIEAPILGDVFVRITQVQPDNQCDCPRAGHQVSQESNGNVHDDLNWKRYPCELNDGDVYYVAIDGSQNKYCDPVGFVIHAQITNVLQLPIALSGNSSRVVGFYESASSANSAESRFTIAEGQYTVMSWSVNAQPGDILTVDVSAPANALGDNLSVELWLSINTFLTPSGTNDGSNVGPSPRSCGAPALCTLTSASTCEFYLAPCDLPNGAATIFLTFGGELLPLQRVSDILSVSIRHIRAEALINVPTISDYTSIASSGLVFADTIDRGNLHSFFTTSATMGINAGDSVTFTFSGVQATGLYVRLGGETGTTDEVCAFTCSDPTTGSSLTCTVRACESVTAATWHIGLRAVNGGTGSFSVQRTVAPAGSLSVVSPALPLNTPTLFTALGNDEWRYHTYSISASDSSHYELVISGGANSGDMVSVSSPIFLPGYTLDPRNNPTDVTLFNSGTTAATCGGSGFVLPQATCCYDASTRTFAVVGPVGDYTLELQFVEFEMSQTTISPPTQTSVQTATNGRVAWYSFTMNSGNHLWFDFSVESGSAELYLNRGSRAGSDAVNFENGGDFGFCWGNDGIVGNSVCNGQVGSATECNGFLQACSGCLADNQNSVFFFGVIPNPNATFVLTVVSQVGSQALSTGSNSGLRLPVSAGNSVAINDDAAANDAFAPYSHYTYTYNTSPYTQTNYIPVRDDPLVDNNFDYDNVQFIFSNFQNLDQATAASPSNVNIYINNGAFAGTGASCYGGRDITTGGSLLPCIENGNGAGAALESSTNVTCSVRVCDLACPTTIFFSTAKATTTFDDYSYSVQINNRFNGLTNWVDIATLTLSTSIQTISYSNANSLNEGIYYRISYNNFPGHNAGTTNWYDMVFTNVNGDATGIDVRFFNGLSCTTMAASADLCQSFTSDDTCTIQLDPCTASGENIVSQHVDFVRVARKGGVSANGVWGFTLTVQPYQVTPIDATATRLSTPSAVSYSRTKEILDRQWHFYTFDISQDSSTWGYDWLSVSVTNVCCNDAALDLNVYFSWDEDLTDSVTDSARPNRYPTEDCNVVFGTADISNDITDLCTFFSGEYRVGIYADFGLQNYPDTILGTEYPALYDISARVNTATKNTILLECEESGAGPTRIEVPIEATNRGAKVEFSFVANAAGTLFASKNANPWRRTSGALCAWGTPTSSTPATTVLGDYFCSVDLSDNSCIIAIPECEFVDNTWFLFVQVAAGVSWTVDAEYYRPYTPVWDLTDGASASTSGVVLPSFYQYYKVVVNSADPDFFFKATITTVDCFGCVNTLYLIDGPIGSAAASQIDSSGVDCDGCSDVSCNTNNGDAACAIESYHCNPEYNQYYLGVTGSSCHYELEVTVVADVQLLEEDVITCSSVYCKDFWQVVDATGSSDMTERTVQVVIDNTSGDYLLVYFGTISAPYADCNDESHNCTSGNTCTYTINCLTVLYVTVEASTPEASQVNCDRCDGQLYAITVSITDVTLSTVALGSAISTSNARFVAGSDFYISSGASSAAWSVGVYGDDCAVTCSSSPSLPGGLTYYFENSVGVVLSALPTVQAISTSFTTVTLTSQYFHFSVTPPAGVDSFTVEFDDVSYCRCGASGGANLNLRIRRSTDLPPFDGCVPCTGTNFLSGSGCNTFADLSYSCTPNEVNYFTITQCSTAVCPISFRMRAVFASARPLLAGTHATPFTLLSAQQDCADSRSFGFYTTVSGANPILSVTLKEPYDETVSAVVSYTRADSEICSGNSCGISATSAGVDSSCRIDEGSYCNSYLSCLAAGTYYVDVSLSTGVRGSQASLQVVNQWVDLSGSASSSIIGEHKHFYRINNADSAVSIQLAIQSGPPVIMTVFDSCGSTGFHEKEVCAFGRCNVWIPTLAKHSLRSTFYVTLESGSITPGNAPAQWVRNTNYNAEKPTDYTLSVVLGSSNCAAPPNTGFCADSTKEGVNVWSDISNSVVWDWIRSDWKDAEAQCRFNELLDICPTPTPECRRWLKIFSCLESFPQCDGSGFQLGMCRDVCTEVESHCGAFITSSPHPEFTCCSDRYVDVVGNNTASSTCYNIPPPPPPPPAIDEPNFDSASSGFPPSIDAPEFSTIFAYFPPLSNFFKDAEVEREVVESSSSLLVPFFSMLLAFIVGLF